MMYNPNIIIWMTLNIFLILIININKRERKKNSFLYLNCKTYSPKGKCLLNYKSIMTTIYNVSFIKIIKDLWLTKLIMIRGNLK
jgi:hypothetical protein